MTVQELKEILDEMNPDMEVKFSYSYGDYWRTQVAANISDVDYGYVSYSDYHQMDKVSEDENEDTKYVVLLS
jgi:hypothetical protein